MSLTGMHSVLWAMTYVAYVVLQKREIQRRKLRVGS